MTSVVDDKILSKLRKLLKLSNIKHNNSIGEASLALQKFNELLYKHHIDISSVDETYTLEIVEDVAATYKAVTLPQWMTVICKCVCLITDTRTLVERSPDGILKLSFVGDSIDVISAKELYVYIRKTVMKFSNEHIKSVVGNKNKCWRSYIEGITTTLYQRCLESKSHETVKFKCDISNYEEDSSESTNSNSIAVYESCKIEKIKRIDEYINNYKSYRQRYTAKIVDSSYSSGCYDSHKISLNNKYKLLNSSNE